MVPSPFRADERLLYAQIANTRVRATCGLIIREPVPWSPPLLKRVSFAIGDAERSYDGSVFGPSALCSKLKQQPRADRASASPSQRLRPFSRVSVCPGVGTALVRRGLPELSEVRLAPSAPRCRSANSPHGTGQLRTDAMKIVMAIISRLNWKRPRCSHLHWRAWPDREVKGYGRQKGHTEIYRGAEYAVSFLQIENRGRWRPIWLTRSSIHHHDGRTGQIGDGKIFVTPLEQAVRIRTDDHALSQSPGHRSMMKYVPFQPRACAECSARQGFFPVTAAQLCHPIGHFGLFANPPGRGHAGEPAGTRANDTGP